MPELSGDKLVIIKDRYLLDTENNWSDLSKRVATKIGAYETTSLQEEFERIIYNQLFIPGGRILRNAGRSAGSLMNCNVLPVGDSREEIGQLFKELLILWGEGCGVGINWTPLRPKGAPIHRVGGNSSGLLSFLQIADHIGSIIKVGGSRRAAGAALIHIYHPEIEDVINAKLKDGTISGFNISIGINRDFLDAVRRKKPYNLRFGSYVKEVDATKLWYMILENMLNNGEPGLVYLDNFRKNNSYYFSPPISINPCLTGETLVYVADGRDYVPIKQLAEEGKDVPVFSYNESTKNTEIQMMRNPRITGTKQRILKITLDDGSVIRCTENHKVSMKDGSYKNANTLQQGDRLHHMTTFHAAFDEIIRNSNSKSKDYIWATNGNKAPKPLHRIIAKFNIKRDFKKHEVVHHKDRNPLNNTPSNLEVMSKQKHDKLHGQDMVGDLNPMRRFPEKNWLVTQDWSGENNGRYIGFTPDQIFGIAVEYAKKLNRRVTQDEWYAYIKENNLPNSQYSIGRYTSASKMLYDAAKVAGVVSLKYSAHIRDYKLYLQIKDETDLDIFFNNGIKVNKNCELCGKPFVVAWGKREQGFCSMKCGNTYASHTEQCRKNQLLTINKKQKETRQHQIGLYHELKETLNRTPYRKEWEQYCKKNNVTYRIRTKNEKNINKYCFRSYKELKEIAELNFKVVSVEFDGYEDVYNGTVDFNHNFYTLGSTTSTDSGKPKYNNILSKQCGEQILPAYGSCNLGSLVLPKFVTEGGSTRWKALEDTINLAVRFLDNVIDINRFSLKKMETEALNSRNIGLGTMGLGDYLFAKKLRYGSPESIVEAEALYKFIRDTAYQASINLAQEKGSFAKFDRFMYLDASFIRKLPVKIRLGIEEYGIRNCNILTQPPTGTTSLVAGCTSGVEPLISKAHIRKDRIGQRVYVHPIYEKIINEHIATPDWYVDSFDLTPEDHLEMQTVIQRYCCSGVSKTINIPEKIKIEDFDKLIREYIQQIKGMTVYRQGSRENQILTPITKKEAKEYLKKQETSNMLDEDLVSCNTGTCEL